MVDCDNNMMRFHKWNDFDRLTISLGHDFCGKTRGDPRNLLIIFFPTDMMQTHFSHTLHGQTKRKLPVLLKGGFLLNAIKM